MKATHRHARLWAPRQVELGRELRVAGLPRQAERLGARTFEAEVWEGPAESVRRGHAGEVAVYRRRVSIRGRDYRRLHLPKGVTAPMPYPAGEGGASAAAAA